MSICITHSRLKVKTRLFLSMCATKRRICSNGSGMIFETESGYTTNGYMPCKYVRHLKLASTFDFNSQIKILAIYHKSNYLNFTKS